MPSLFDKWMENTVKESQQTAPSVAHAPQEKITRKPESPKNPFPVLPKSRSPEIPYYTQLPYALQDEIKVYAIRHKLKDYEVVTQAIEEFFKKSQ